MSTEIDFLIIGGGIAGASVACELAAHGRVVLLEREAQAGYHATGRSAATFAASYGNAVIRALTAASRAFFTDPPPGFAEHPLLSPRGVVCIARVDQQAALEREYEQARATLATARYITPAEARRLVPVLRPDYVAAAMFEPESMDLDANAIHQGFLRGLRARGGRAVTGAEVVTIEPANGGWRVTTSAAAFTAPVLVNAAGAWADVLARLAGVPPVGLVPKRRTAVTFDPLEGSAIAGWPMVTDAEEQFYFKPDAGRILASPADETPCDPCDAHPDELDIAIAIDRIEQVTTLTVRRLHSKWAGLRSFVADKTPVVGFDPAAEGFFWLAGQGGYGIQTSPTMGRLAAALATGRGMPADLVARGITEAALSPTRFATPQPRESAA